MLCHVSHNAAHQASVSNDFTSFTAQSRSWKVCSRTSEDILVPRAQCATQIVSGTDDISALLLNRRPRKHSAFNTFLGSCHISEPSSFNAISAASESKIAKQNPSEPLELSQHDLSRNQYGKTEDNEGCVHSDITTSTAVSNCRGMRSDNENKGTEVHSLFLPDAASRVRKPVITASSSKAVYLDSSISGNNRSGAITSYPILTSFAAGGFAGFTVDLALLPLDTLKTRLQSDRGFWQAGGFRRVYDGVVVVAAASVPGAALFFASYEGAKMFWSSSLAGLLNSLGSGTVSANGMICHGLSAVCAEAVAAFISVPKEVIKQRIQVSSATTETRDQQNKTRTSESDGDGDANAMSLHGSATGMVADWIRCKLIMRTIYHGNVNGLADCPHKNNTSVLNFYAGYQATLARNIPFNLIQYPLYEYLKASGGILVLGKKTIIGASLLFPFSTQAASLASAIAAHVTLPGSVTAILVSSNFTLLSSAAIAGAIAAGLTTPMDVVKTRIMLGEEDEKRPRQDSSTSALATLRHIHETEGVAGLFSGASARIASFAVGGVVFFGSYEGAKALIEHGCTPMHAMTL